MAGLTRVQEAKLREYLAELGRWNRRRNLSAVALEDAWHRHVEESLRLLAAATVEPGSALVDVGSGAGVPGLVVAVVRSDVSVHLLESDAHKQGFLVHVAGLLDLDNVSVLGCRAEAAGRDPSHRERFDVALSRATAPPAVLCELALPLLRIGGRLCALVADNVAAAAECVVAARLCGGGAPDAAEAGVLVVEKVAPTPQRYPRRPGMPIRRPLHGP